MIRRMKNSSSHHELILEQATIVSQPQKPIEIIWANIFSESNFNKLILFLLSTAQTEWKEFKKWRKTLVTKIPFEFLIHSCSSFLSSTQIQFSFSSLQIQNFCLAFPAFHSFYSHRFQSIWTLMAEKRYSRNLFGGKACRRVKKVLGYQSRFIRLLQRRMWSFHNKKAILEKAWIILNEQREARNPWKLFYTSLFFVLISNEKSLNLLEGELSLSFSFEEINCNNENQYLSTTTDAYFFSQGMGVKSTFHLLLQFVENAHKVILCKNAKKVTEQTILWNLLAFFEWLPFVNGPTIHIIAARVLTPVYPIWFERRKMFNFFSTEPHTELSEF